MKTLTTFSHILVLGLLALLFVIKRRPKHKKRLEAWREKNFERIILPAGTPLRGMMLKKTSQIAALFLVWALWLAAFFRFLLLTPVGRSRSEVMVLGWGLFSVSITFLLGSIAFSSMQPQIPNDVKAKGARLFLRDCIALGTMVAVLFGLLFFVLNWLFMFIVWYVGTGVLSDGVSFVLFFAAMGLVVGVMAQGLSGVQSLLGALRCPSKLECDTVAIVPRASFTDRMIRILRIFAAANVGVFLVIAIFFSLCLFPFFILSSGPGHLVLVLLSGVVSGVVPMLFVGFYDRRHPVLATAQSDRQGPWWKRLFLFLSEPMYKVVEFPAGFRMRAYAWRQIMILLGIFCFAIILVGGFEPQGAALLVPFAYVALFLISAYLVVSSVFRPRSFVERPFQQGHANEKFLSRFFSPRTKLLFSRRYAVLEEKTAFLCFSEAGFRAMYIIVFAGILLALLSTPFRPMPLEPPPSHLMARVHPCLLDENGDVHAPKTIVVDGVRTVDDVMNVVTNSGRPDFQVAAAFLEFHDRFAKFRDALRDFERLAETNVVEKGDLDACPEIGQCVAALERLMKTASAAQGPQFGPGDVVPDFASSRRDYVERDRSVFLPVFSTLLESCSVLLSAARDERDLVYAVSLVQHASEKFYDVFRIDCAYGMHNKKMAGAVLSMSERLTISAEGADAIRQAFESGSAEETCLRKNVQEAYLGFAAWAPATGDSYWKALRVAFDGSSNVPFGLKGYDSQTSGFMNSLSGVLWSPAAAALCGYDVDAQLATMKARRQWLAVAASCALDADSSDGLSEAYRQARFASLFCRGGMIGAFDESVWRLNDFERPHFGRNILMARYNDGCAMVADVALRLSQFRSEKGRDAESLAEVEETLGWKPREDRDLEVFYEPIPTPEGVFAYAIGLKPKVSCRKAFENTGVAWLVVRNPNFAGTLGRRFLSFMQYDGDSENSPELSWEWHVGEEADKNDPFALPATLFGDDPAALEKTVKALWRAGWYL